MSLVQPYIKLRNDLAQRDRSLREKVVSLAEAASFVHDGDSVGIGGSTMSRTPMGLIWALIRAKRRRLSCSRCIVSSDGDLLYGSGASEHIITSWFSQGILWGVSKVMRHYVESGKARYDEWSHMAMGMRFRAGAMGVPFMPIRSMLGSGVVSQRPEAKEMICPFTNEKLLLVPAPPRHTETVFVEPNRASRALRCSSSSAGFRVLDSPPADDRPQRLPARFEQFPIGAAGHRAESLHPDALRP